MTKPTRSFIWFSVSVCLDGCTKVRLVEEGVIGGGYQGFGTHEDDSSLTGKLGFP